MPWSTNSAAFELMMFPPNFLPMPLVSVVMPSYQQARFICESIDSVLSQSYPNVELIVADGGSRDDTVAILQRRAEQDPRLRWFSRPDRGPAHAINDALQLVRGTIIGWLNSDDLYTAGAILRAVDALAADPALLMVYGHGQHVDAASAVLDDYPTLPPSTPIARFKEGCYICQPTMFMQRTAQVLLGKLDEEFKASFDFDYWLRAFTFFQSRIGFVDAVQAYSRLHEDCITLRLRQTVALEGMRLLAHHLGSAPKEWLLTYFDELMLHAPASSEIENMRQHALDMINTATPWMTAGEKNELETAITRRLHGI